MDMKKGLLLKIPKGMNEAQILEMPMEEVSELLREVFAKGGTLPLTVKGGSMYPFLRPMKDRVVLSRPAGKPVGIGDILLVRSSDGIFVLHRIWRIQKNGDFFLLGDGQTVPEGPFSPNQVIARVEAWWRGNRLISCNAFPMRMLSRLWLWIRPVRPLFQLGAGVMHHIKRLLFRS